MHLESLNSKFKTIIKFLRQIFIELKVTIICIVRTKIKQKYAKKGVVLDFYLVSLPTKPVYFYISLVLVAVRNYH